MLFGSYLQALFAVWHIVNQGYHEIDLDIHVRLNKKLRNRKDSQTISGMLLLFFLNDLWCSIFV